MIAQSGQGPKDCRLADMIGLLHPLPSPRGVALQLLRLARRDRASVADVADVAQADPALAEAIARGSAVAAPPAWNQAMDRCLLRALTDQAGNRAVSFRGKGGA